MVDAINARFNEARAKELGNSGLARFHGHRLVEASMRPEQKSSGIPKYVLFRCRAYTSFNEARAKELGNSTVSQAYAALAGMLQ